MKTVGNFSFIETEIKDLYVIEPKLYGDSRGYFMETYKQSAFEEAGLNYNFVQDNQSKSKKGVLRGEGEVFDVAVDLRKGSTTYGKWFGVVLSAENNKQFMIPRGFAHGFLVLSETAVFCYKCDELYHPEDEGGIIWNDPEIGIVWPSAGDILLSEKDKKHLTLKQQQIEF